MILKEILFHKNFVSSIFICQRFHKQDLQIWIVNFNQINQLIKF